MTLQLARKSSCKLWTERDMLRKELEPKEAHVEDRLGAKREMRPGLGIRSVRETFPFLALIEEPSIAFGFAFSSSSS